MNTNAEPGEGWEVVFRGYDLTSLSLVEALLESNDIPHRRIGRANAALLGIGEGAIVQLISVPASRAADAARLVRDAEAGDVDDVEVDQNVAASITGASRKTRLVAAGMSVLWPGLGLAYAGAFLPGFALAGWSFIAMAAGRGPYSALAAFMFGHGIARVVDLAGSQCLLTLRQLHRGTKSPRFHGTVVC